MIIIHGNKPQVTKYAMEHELRRGRYVDSVDKLYILEVEVEVEVGAVYV